MPGDLLLWCASRKATMGLVVRGETVVDAAPYVRRWTMGRNIFTLLPELKKRGFRVAVLNTDGGGFEWL